MPSHAGTITICTLHCYGVELEEVLLVEDLSRRQPSARGLMSSASWYFSTAADARDAASSLCWSTLAACSCGRAIFVDDGVAVLRVRRHAPLNSADGWRPSTGAAAEAVPVPNCGSSLSGCRRRLRLDTSAGAAASAVPAPTAGALSLDDVVGAGARHICWRGRLCGASSHCGGSLSR